jgi:hypothetical protein
MIVVAMTSNPSGAVAGFSFVVDNIDLERGTLNRPGFVRSDKIYNLAQSLIVTVFGRVKPVVVDRIRTLLHNLTVP